MTLAQVQAAAAFVSYLILTWAGLIIAVALLVPGHADRARIQAQDHTAKSIVAGLAMLIPIAFALAMVQGAPLLRFLGMLVIFASAGTLVLGSSGIALILSKRISGSGTDASEFGGLLRGALVYSLGLGFPFVGWFLFLPVALITSLGAGVRALISARKAATPAAPQYEILTNQGAAQ